MDRPLFHPTFGSRPAQIIGRDQVIEQFMSGLSAPIGSRDRCTFFVGQRGMGKTALLLELAERAAKDGFIVARVTAYSGMADEIIELIQRNGAPFITEDNKKIQGIEAGAFGFSFGLTFSETVQKQYGFRTKLTLLCDKLSEYNLGVLILIDEATTSEELREVAITYQHLVGEDKNIAIAMAGLPNAVSNVLNDKVLTFLNRASKITLGPISPASIHVYYTNAFEQLGIIADDSLVTKAAEAAQGFPYLMQLIGYYTTQYTKAGQHLDDAHLQLAINAARQDMDQNVFRPILMPLSAKDLEFLKAMAMDDGVSSSSDIAKRMNKSNSYIQPYRARLIDAGIIESPRKGELEFAVPYLADYLRKNGADPNQ